MWPDRAIYWTLAKFLKPLATINLPKSLTFLDNFGEGVKIYNFSSEIIFGQLLWTFGDFFLVALDTTNFYVLICECTLFEYIHLFVYTYIHLFLFVPIIVYTDVSQKCSYKFFSISYFPKFHIMSSSGDHFALARVAISRHIKRPIKTNGLHLRAFHRQNNKREWEREWCQLAEWWPAQKSCFALPTVWRG